MADKKPRGTTLYSPEGESYTTADPAERNRLQAAGYSTKRPSAPAKKTTRSRGSRRSAGSTSSGVSTPSANGQSTDG